MNILIISDDLKTGKTTGANIRLLKLIKYISRDHKDVKFEIYTPFTSEDNIMELPNTNIHYIKSKLYSYIIRTFPKRNNIFKKIIWKILTYPGTTDYLWVRKALSEILINGGNKKYDLILLQVPSYLNIIYGSILKNKMKIPLIYDLRDDLINIKNIVGKKYIEKKMVKNGDKIVCVTEMSLNNMKNKYEFCSSKFKFIPNGYDPEDLILDKITIKNSKSNIKSIVYTGTIDKNRANVFISIFKILNQLNNTINNLPLKLNLLIFTNQSNIDILVKKFNLEKIVFINNYITDRNKYFSILANSDMLLSVNYNTHFSIPGKLYEYLIFKEQVIHIDNSSVCNEVLRYFPKSKLILFDEIAGIQNIIRQILLSDGNKAKKINFDNLPIKFINKYHRANIAKKYLQTVNGII